MAEFRLNCPGCGAEYVLPQDAIPAAGREVECSRCDHVWQAQRPTDPSAPLDLGSFTTGNDDEAPAPLPPASKRLSADVLDILRDEVEHERRLREADSLPPAAIPPMPDNDWPATTVTVPAAAPRQRPEAGNKVAKSPTVIRHLPARSTTPLPKPEPQLAPRPAPTEAPAPAPQPQPAPIVASPAAQGGYRLGFGLSVLAAACCVGLYVATPKLAAQDLPFAEGLLQLRADVDQARLWLSDRVTKPGN